MKTNCAECGMSYEVGESQKNSHMFCLECDKFFKIIEVVDDPEKKSDIDIENIEYENDPPKMSEAMPEEKPFALINDFLESEIEMENENEPEDEPAEYIDFLSVGLDVSSSDFLENHDKNIIDKESYQKDQE